MRTWITEQSGPSPTTLCMPDKSAHRDSSVLADKRPKELCSHRVSEQHQPRKGLQVQEGMTLCGWRPAGARQPRPRRPPRQLLDTGSLSLPGQAVLDSLPPLPAPTASPAQALPYLLGSSKWVGDSRKPTWKLSGLHESQQPSRELGRMPSACCCLAWFLPQLPGE